MVWIIDEKKQKVVSVAPGSAAMKAARNTYTSKIDAEQVLKLQASEGMKSGTGHG